MIIRIRFSRKLFADDYFCLLALSILIANSVVTQLMAPPMYNLLEVATQRAKPGPTFMARSTFYLKCQFVSTVLFWSCLWAVKGCFLAFFFRLTNRESLLNSGRPAMSISRQVSLTMAGGLLNLYQS